MGRSPCCEKVGLKKGPWTPEEDQKLLAYIEEHGHGSWRALPAKAGLQRCGKSCRLRWTNYLRPDIKRGKFSLQEEQTIIQLHALLGNRWSAIATHLPKRTDNEIKNYWNTHLKKRLTKMGIDPVTHKPRSDTLSCAAAASGGAAGGAAAAAATKSAATLSHMAQWESARLEAEARLARESKIRAAAAAAAAAAPQNGAVATNQISATPAQCLDVLRAWQQGGAGGAAGWVSSKARSDLLCPSTAAGRMIDLQQEHSPTSTLSFSENGTAVPNMARLSSFAADHAATSAMSGASGDHQYEAGDKTVAGWRCFDRSLRVLDYAKDEDHAPQDQLSNPAASSSHHLGGFPNLEEPQPLVFSSPDTAAPWQLPEVNPLKQQASSASTSSGTGHHSGFGDGFTEMLLLERTHDDSSSHSDNDALPPVVAGHHVHNELDENKMSYWNSILINLVNPTASSPSSSAPRF